MNIMTAYHVADFLKRQSDNQGFEYAFVSRRWLTQALNRQKGLNETIDEMIADGLIEQHGGQLVKGLKTMRELTLSAAGRTFLANFIDFKLPFVLAIDPQVWFEFTKSVIGCSLDPQMTLAKLLTDYTRKKNATEPQPVF